MRPQLMHQATLGGHRAGVYALARGLEEGTFYTSGSDGQVAEWRTADPTQARGLAKMDGACWALATLPDPGLLVLGLNRQGLHFIDLHSRQALGSLALPPADFFALEPTGPAQVAVGGSDGSVHLVDPIAGRLVASAQVSAKAIRTLRLWEGHTLLAAGSDGQVRLLRLPGLEVLAAWPAHTPTVMALCPLPGRRLVTGGRDARIRLWQLDDATPTLLQEVPAHHYAVYDLAADPTGTLLLSASMDKTLKLWDAATLRLLRVHDKARHQGHSSSVNRCLWLSATQAVSCSDDRTAILWTLQEVS